MKRFVIKIQLILTVLVVYLGLNSLNSVNGVTFKFDDTLTAPLLTAESDYVANKRVTIEEKIKDMFGADVNRMEYVSIDKNENTLVMTKQQIDATKYMFMGGYLLSENDLEQLKQFKNVEYIVLSLYVAKKWEYPYETVKEYARYIEFIANNFPNLKGLSIDISSMRELGYNSREGFKLLSKLTKLETLKIAVITEASDSKSYTEKYTKDELEQLKFKENFKLEYLTEMSNLKSIDLYNVEIEEKNLNKLGKLPNLEKISINSYEKSNINDITAINSSGKISEVFILSSSSSVNINVNTKNYKIPFDYEYMLKKIDQVTPDISSLFKSGNSTAKELNITGATFSSDKSTVVFPSSAVKGSKATISYGAARLIITYMGANYKYPDGIIKIGDANEDFVIDINDAILMLKSITGKISLTDSQKIYSDTNKDGKVDIQDAIQILKYIVGKITSFN